MFACVTEQIQEQTGVQVGNVCSFLSVCVLVSVSLSVVLAFVCVVLVCVVHAIDQNQTAEM